MKKIGEKLTQIILILFVLTFGWTIINGIFLGQDAVFSYNKIGLIFGIIFYMIIALVTYKKVIPKIIKNKYIPIILMIVFTIICLIVGYKLRVNPSWDMGRVFEIASKYANGTINQDDYLYEFPNNIAITYIFIAVLKIANIIKIENLITAITIFNSIVVCLTVISLYYATKRVFNEKTALMFLIISLFTTPLYLYTAIYYTDTMSMLFAALTFLLYAYSRSEQNKLKRTVLEILFGITIILCIKVKITSAFVVIAMVVYDILSGKIIKFSKKFWITILSAALCFILCVIIQNRLILPDLEKQKYIKMPIEHWILTGLVGNGGYNSEIRDYTGGFSGYEEKRKGDIEKIKETIKEYNIGTFVDHINQKLKFAWSDGTYYAPEKLWREPLNKGFLYEFVAKDGSKTNLYKYFPQSMHFGMLIFMVIDILIILKNKKLDKKDIILAISVFGLLVFLLLWENRSRYILTLVPIMLILEARGIEGFCDYIKNFIGEKKQ